MALIVLLVGAVLVITMVRLVLRLLRLNSYVKTLPKIPFAVLMPLFRRHKTSVELFQFLEKIGNYYDGLASFWVGTILVVICDDPVNMKTILMSKHCVEKPYLYRLVTAIGDGILLAKAHDWRADRKGINAVFRLSILQKLQPIFNRHFGNFARSLEQYVDLPEFDFTQHIIACNLDLALETSCRYSSGSKNRSKLMEWIARQWDIALERLSNFHLHSSFIYRFTKLHVEEKKISEFSLEFAQNILACAKENDATELSDDYKDTNSTHLIDKLMELERKDLMDRKRVLEQINSFVVAGTDTSSITMLNTLLLLAIHPNVQDRLYEEIRTTATNDDHIEYEILSKLEYMERVLKESMRLLPLTHFWLRETDDEIQLTGCTVPEGTMLALCVLKMHRNVKIWGPTANDFDPDRFLPEAVAQRHPFAFVPFSAGPRNCIGNRYAMISMKVMLCHLLLKYKLSTSMKMNDIRFKFEFLLKLDNKYMFKLEKRTVH